MKTNKNNFELRMYFLTMYNISPIQQGIQCLHAVVEYFLKHWKDKEFWRWALKYKTVIILNGGTSNDGMLSNKAFVPTLGSMEQHFKTLKDNKIKCTCFNEPDLNYSMSAIAFLVDERVFNKEKYPDFSSWANDLIDNMEHISEADKLEKRMKKEKYYDQYVREVGKDIAFLKDFLKQFRLA